MVLDGFRNQSSEGEAPSEAESSLELLVFLVTLVQKYETVIKTQIFDKKTCSFWGVLHTFEGF